MAAAAGFGLITAAATPGANVELSGQIRFISGGSAANDWGNSGTLDTATSNGGGGYNTSCTPLSGVAAGQQIHADGTGGLFDCGGPNATAGHVPIGPKYIGPTVDAKVFLVDPLANQGRSDLGNTCLAWPNNTTDTDPTTYTNSTKNGDPLNTYTFGPGTNTPKDDLANVYAIAKGGEVDFAAERVINNGDSHMDFEFLQNDLAASAGSKSCQGSFSGHRAEGDFLLSADFPGNTTAAVTDTVHEWHCLTESNTQPGEGFVCDPGTSPTAAQCSTLGLSTTGGTHSACSTAWSPHYQDISSTTRATDSITFTVNGGDILCGGWVCRDEMSPANAHHLSTYEFMEGGIDLAGLGFTGCVSSFLPHTRSSSSFTAQLKDFGGPLAFHTCSINTTAQAASSSHSAGAMIGDSALVDGFTGSPGVVTFDLYKLPSGTDPATVGTVGGPQCVKDVGQSDNNWVQQITGTTAASGAPATFTTAATAGGDANVYQANDPGLYEWVASYFETASATTPEVVSGCGLEPWAINQSTPDLSTSPSPSSTVDITTITGPMNDTAAVGSLAHPGSNPAAATGTGLGKVTFKLYGPFTSAPTSTSCVDTGNTGANQIAAANATVSGTNASGALSGISANYSTGFTTGHGFTPTSPGWYQWVASYLGNTANAATAGSCGTTSEQVRLVDAYLQIAPLSATNVIGNDHVITATVKVNDGSGLANAPDGTTVTFSLLAGSVGAFKNATNTCTTTSGTCTVTDTSSSAGTDTIHATISITVGGITLNRATGDSVSSDSANAVKNWVSPYTRETVFDQLYGLGTGATGTVYYRAYTSSTLCGNDTTFISGTTEGSTTTITNGVANQSSSVQIGPNTSWGTEIWWRSEYVGSGTGNEGTFISGCTESAVDTAS